MTQRFFDQMTPSHVLPTLVAVCLMAAMASPVAASSPGDKEPTERQAHEAFAEDAFTTKKIRVIYDPETGEIISVPLRENEVLSAPLAKALIRSAEGLPVFELANGGTGVHLDGRFQHALMVRVKSDGSIETVCTSHSHAAEKFLKRTSAGADVEPRDQ